MQYNYTEIEKKWLDTWEKQQTYKVENDPSKPKYYVLDMFPYPSGAGLHVGHPLGYIASDIYSRYKRLKGFNVLHPMGFDAFGLPAEQYAIETGQRPQKTVAENIVTYKQQLQNLGLSFDWSREVKTCDPEYFKWTQWAFMQLFQSWYNKDVDKAESIDTLIAKFETDGTASVNGAASDELIFSAQEWKAMSDDDKERTLLNYRLAYQSYSDVWYCEALGTVLAQDEIINGRSERGNHPVEKRKLRQWFLRITAYADRLLNGLDTVDWSNAMKEQQRNWIGKSYGASMFFDIQGHNNQKTDQSFEIFTTRPDTIFGVSYMVLAPEHELVAQITTPEQKEKIDAYLDYVNTRSERDRMSEVKKVTGGFTGAYAIHPFTKKPIPIWIGEYVLASYGTGAIMAVPADDERDQAFAEKFDLPIIQIIDKSEHPGAGYEDKVGKMINSDFLNGLEVNDAIQAVNKVVGELGIGKAKVQFRLRDAGFSRQRYWGEPFPVVYKDETNEAVPILLKESDLPLSLPEVDSYKPTTDARSPLAAERDWVELPDGTFRETDTMPGYAGSSWYFLRYMDPHNEKEMVSKEAVDYWGNVDFYLGGSEHAVGHLLYSRMWHKFFKDVGIVNTEEPYKKLVNQGMIQGVIEFMYLMKEKKEEQFHFVCSKKVEAMDLNVEEDISKIPIHIDFVTDYGSDNSYMTIDNIKRFIDWRPEYSDAIFECGKGVYHKGKFRPANPNETDSMLITQSEVGKMSKSKYNVVNPDDMIAKYGADVFRMYEMFLGPLEASKPWDTKGISGVAKFTRKFWNLFHNEENFEVSDEAATDKEMKVLHQTIKKIEDDIKRLSFNTCVSAFMVACNELTSMKCNKRAILEPMVAMMAPFAPFIAEELWQQLGKEGSVHHTSFPVFEEKYVKENDFEYPVMIGGKMRTKISLPLDLDEAGARAIVLADDKVMKYTEGKDPKRFIYVKSKIVNIVV